MAQEEVRGQGSEVVHFIDRALPISRNPPCEARPWASSPSPPPIGEEHVSPGRPQGLGVAGRQGRMWGGGCQPGDRE